MQIHSIVIFVDLRSEGLVLVLNSLLGVHVWLLLGFFVLALASWGFD
jgi:hypothetical protein